MADTERKIIPVMGKQAQPYIDAIEGLIFDPQPYKSPTENIQLKEMLSDRWLRAVAHQFDVMTQNIEKKDPKEDDRVFIYDGAPLYIVNERPSLLVATVNHSRRYQIDLQLVKDRRYLFVFSFLHLQELREFWSHKPEASLFLNSLEMRRMAKGQEFDDACNYLPSFTEQQRLLKVAKLLREHI